MIQNLSIHPSNIRTTFNTKTRVIPVRVQNALIIYQLPFWPRNELQMFKPDNNPQLSVYKTPTCRLGSLLIFWRQTQTEVFLRVCRIWDCVLWTVVIVWVRSVSVSVLLGEWKLPGEKKVIFLLFGIKKSSGMICDRTWAYGITYRLRLAAGQL